MRVGRNDPCPCGSGKKYKRCCLAVDQTLARAPVSQPAPIEHMAAPFETAEARALEQRWQRFESAPDLRARLTILREYLGQSVLLEDEAFDLLGHLHDELRAVSPAPEDRRTFVAAVEAVRARMPEEFRGGVGYYHDWLIEEALALGEDASLPRLLEPFAREPARVIDEFFEVARRLMYHGQARPLLGAMRRAWPRLRRSREVLPEAIDGFAETLVTLVLFDYLESAPTPRADDPALRASLDQVELVDEEQLRTDVPALLGEMAGPVDPEVGFDVHRLTVEWIGDARRRGGVALSKSELARGLLAGHLIGRRPKARSAEEASSGAEGLLLPKPGPFQRVLESYLGDGSGEEYAVGAVLELLPSYLVFLVRRGLVPAETADRRGRELQRVRLDLARRIREHGGDPLVVRAIERSGWTPSSA